MASPTTTARRPRGGPPGRPRLVRQERQPAAPRARAAGSCSARWSPTRRCRVDGGAGGRRLRLVPALPRRLPDRRHRRARRASTPAAAWRGCCRSRACSRASSGSRSATASTAATTARRCARPTGARWARPTPAAAPWRPASRVRRRARPARRRRRQRARRLGAAGTSPTATPSGCGATPSSCSATSATACDPAVVDALAPLPRRPRPAAARPRRLGGAPPRARPICSHAADERRRRACGPSWRARRGPRSDRVKHLLVTNDFPPKIGGIQSYLWELWRRLPPDDASPCSPPRTPAAAEFDRAQPFRVERVARAGAAAAPVADGRASASWPARSAPTSSCSTRRSRSASSARRSALPYGVVLHGAEVTVPGRLPGQPPAARARPARRPARHRRRRLPGGRGRARRRARRCPSTIVPAGRRHRPVRPARRRRPPRRPRALRPAASTASSSSRVSRLVPRKGFDTAHPGRGAGCAASVPTSCWRSPAAGATERRLERLAGELRRPGALPRPGARRRPARRSTAAPTCSPCCAATAGSASSRRASASCSSRRRRAASPRWPGRPAAPPRRSSTARPASSCATRPTRSEVAAAFARLLDDPAGARRMGEAARARAVAEFSYDVLAARLGRALGALP